MNPTYKPETLLVLRDGQLEDSYYNQIYADKRRQIGREVLYNMVTLPLVIGRNLVALFSE